MNMITNAIVAH